MTDETSQQLAAARAEVERLTRELHQERGRAWEAWEQAAEADDCAADAQGRLLRAVRERREAQGERDTARADLERLAKATRALLADEEDGGLARRSLVEGLKAALPASPPAAMIVPCGATFSMKACVLPSGHEGPLHTSRSGSCWPVEPPAAPVGEGPPVVECVEREPAAP